MTTSETQIHLSYKSQTNSSPINFTFFINYILVIFQLLAPIHTFDQLLQTTNSRSSTNHSLLINCINTISPSLPPFSNFQIHLPYINTFLPHYTIYYHPTYKHFTRLLCPSILSPTDVQPIQTVSISFDSDPAPPRRNYRPNPHKLRPPRLHSTSHFSLLTPLPHSTTTSFTRLISTTTISTTDSLPTPCCHSSYSKLHLITSNYPYQTIN